MKSKSTGKVFAKPSSGAKLAAWRHTVTEVALKHAPAEPLAGPVRLLALFFLPRPKSAKNRPAPDVAPDIDKLARSVADSLSGVMYGDDKQVTTLTALKRYTGGPPFCVIEVGPDPV